MTKSCGLASGPLGVSTFISDIVSKLDLSCFTDTIVNKGDSIGITLTKTAKRLEGYPPNRVHVIISTSIMLCFNSSWTGKKLAVQYHAL